MPRTAYSHLRLTSAEQMVGHRRPCQTTDAEAVCARRRWRLSGQSFADLGVSGLQSKNRRKETLAVFLELLTAKKLDENAVLILDDFDRLPGDNTPECITLLEQILKAGCDIYCTRTSRLYTTAYLDEPLALTELVMCLQLAHAARVKKSDRSKAKWNEKRANVAEKIMTKACPAWLTVKDGKFVKVPARARVIKRIFRWCIDGFGVQAIMQKLSSKGIPPFKSGWSMKYIYQILTDRRVLGDLPDGPMWTAKANGHYTRNYYPRVISDTDYYAALKAMKARKNKIGRKPKGNFLNLFTGIVWYPKHNCPMIFLSKSKGKTYRYLASLKGWKGLAEYVAIPYQQFEMVVLDFFPTLDFSEFLPPSDVLDRLEELEGEQSFIDHRTAELQKELQQMEVKVPAVVKALTDLQVRQAEVQVAIEECKKIVPNRKVNDLEELLELLKSTKGPALRELRERIRQRIMLVIERISVDVGPKEVKLTIKFHSGRLFKIAYNLRKNTLGWVTEDSPGVKELFTRLGPHLGPSGPILG